MVQIRTIFDQLQARVNPQSDVEIALLNYLQAFSNPNEAWTPEIISDFFVECLVYPHWQQNRESLRTQTQSALSTLQQQSRIDLQLEEIKWVTDRQVIQIENPNDWQELLLQHLKLRAYPGLDRRLRLILQGGWVYALAFDGTSGELEVRIYDNRFTIAEGQLVPLRENFTLLYDRNLNLCEGRPYFIELGPFIRGRFQSIGGLFDYYSTRGYLFQKFQTVNRAPIDNIPRLFYPLKKIESLFLKKDSNPFYVSLTQELERMIQQLRLKEPVATRDLMDLLVKARNALEYVYSDDKLLQLFVKELEEKASMQNIEDLPAKERAEPTWALPQHEFVGNKGPETTRSKGSTSWQTHPNPELYDLIDT